MTCRSPPRRRLNVIIQRDAALDTFAATLFGTGGFPRLVRSLPAVVVLPQRIYYPSSSYRTSRHTPRPAHYALLYATPAGGLRHTAAVLRPC